MDVCACVLFGGMTYNAVGCAGYFHFLKGHRKDPF